MQRFFAVLLFLLAGSGCSGWQANKASEAVDIDPTAIGTGNPVITPSNAHGFIDGQALDMRTK